MFSTRKLDMHNRNGAPLCHAFGCRKHKRLIQAFNGWFCNDHLQELSKIRAFKGVLMEPSEAAEWRLKEALFRKKMDAGHMYYISKISNMKK